MRMVLVMLLFSGMSFGEPSTRKLVMDKPEGCSAITSAVQGFWVDLHMVDVMAMRWVDAELETMEVIIHVISEFAADKHHSPAELKAIHKALGIYKKERKVLRTWRSALRKAIKVTWKK